METRKYCPKIILEGTRLTRKTDIAFALNAHPRIVGPRKYPYHSPIISAEWCAFTNYPWGRGLINFNPEEEAHAMVTYRTWLKLFELQKYYSWIIDRFHLSTQVFQFIHHKKKYNFSWMEVTLRDLGFHLVFCTRNPETFEEAKQERVKVSGKPQQYDDLNQFICEQEVFRDLVEESILPVLEVNITDLSVDQSVEMIADWLEETGGLWTE